MRHWAAAVAAALLALAGADGPAAAQGRAEREDYLRFCNKHSRKVQVAVAWLSGEKTREGRQIVISKGWYGLQPGECRNLVAGPLPYRYYYYYAQDGDDAEWRGDYPVCISEKAFTIKDTQCGDGYKRRNFRQVDTQGRKQLTLNLN